MIPYFDPAVLIPRFLRHRVLMSARQCGKTEALRREIDRRCASYEALCHQLLARTIVITPEGDLKMCHQDEKEAPAQDRASSEKMFEPHRWAVFQPDERARELRHPRSKFRPFGAEYQRAERNPAPGFGKDKSDAFELVDLLAMQLALRIEQEREAVGKAGRLDARAEREFDLARTALEDCVMRTKRGITS